MKTECNECDYFADTPWNYKMHYLTFHATIEEKNNNNFYCKICNKIYFCDKYYQKHITGLKHNNKIKKGGSEI